MRGCVTTGDPSSAGFAQFGSTLGSTNPARRDNRHRGRRAARLHCGDQVRAEQEAERTCHGHHRTNVIDPSRTMTGARQIGRAAPRAPRALPPWAKRLLHHRRPEPWRTDIAADPSRSSGIVSPAEQLLRRQPVTPGELRHHRARRQFSSTIRALSFTGQRRRPPIPLMTSTRRIGREGSSSSVWSSPDTSRSPISRIGRFTPQRSARRWGQSSAYE